MRLQRKKLIKYNNKNLKFLSDPITGSINSHCIMTDVWLSMGDKKNKINILKALRLIKNY